MVDGKNKMNTVRRMKNGQYDIHLDFNMIFFIKKNLLKNWVERNKSTPFSNIKQFELLEQMEVALNLPKDVDELFQEEIKSEQFRREYLGQFLDDNNPEGYLTEKEEYKTRCKRL